MKKITLTEKDSLLLHTAMKKYARDWKILRRLKCIELRSEWKTLKEITEKLEVSNDTIANWCTLYLSWWIDALSFLKYEWRRLSVLDVHKERMLKLVDTNTYSTYAEFMSALETEVGGSLGIKWDGFVKFCKKNSLWLPRNVHWNQENAPMKKFRKRWLKHSKPI